MSRGSGWDTCNQVNKTEITFCIIKLRYGSNIRAHKASNMIRELRLTILAHQAVEAYEREAGGSP